MYFEFLGRKLPVYGCIGVAGFFLGMIYILLYCLIRKKKFDNSLYLYVFATLGAMVGAKLLSIIQNIPELINDLSNPDISFGQILKAYLSGGFVFYGGLIGAVIAYFLAAKFFEYDPYEYLPAIAPALPLMHGISRIGCYLVGCCYGAPTTSHICVVYTDSVYAPNGVPMVPVQLFEVILELSIFVMMIILSAFPRNYRKLLDFYFLVYGLGRFILEFWRGDAARKIYGPLSTSQWISIALWIVAIIHLVYIARTKERDEKYVGKQ